MKFTKNNSLIITLFAIVAKSFVGGVTLFHTSKYKEIKKTEQLKNQHKFYLFS